MRLLALLLLLTAATAQGYTQADSAVIKQHISYLASDALGGRAPGTKGERLAQKYIMSTYRRLGLSPRGTRGYLQPFSYRPTANPHDTAAPHRGKTYHGANIIGYLDNHAPYTIIVGAHYDHLGLDGRGSSLDPQPAGKIHHGADDNASGVAGVLELARIYATNGIVEPYNLLFMCFSAEEAGLIGSKYYTQHPTIDKASISCMLNMDMIGRLSDSTHKLLIYGTGTSATWEPLLGQLRSGLTFRYDSSGVGPSDQTSFYLQDIPVLHFFTGQHSDYHKPSDIATKINYPGEKQVIDVIAQLIDSLIQRPRPNFQKTATKEAKSTGFKVTLGIMPDYSYDRGGVRVDGVSDHKPAQKAGMQASDIIIQLGEYPVKDIYSYMDALNKFTKGATTTVTITRGAEKKELVVTF